MKKLLILTVLVLTGVLTASAQTNTEILQRIISQEQKLTRSLASYSPLVETYIQNIEADPDLGSRPKSDRYFLGKLEVVMSQIEPACVVDHDHLRKSIGNVDDRVRHLDPVT